MVYVLSVWRLQRPSVSSVDLFLKISLSFGTTEWYQQYYNFLFFFFFKMEQVIKISDKILVKQNCVKQKQKTLKLLHLAIFVPRGLRLES